ncbi:MAG: acetamidase/formamidase family protein [Acidimicrobiales bacterium]
MVIHRLPADERSVRVGIIDAAHPPVLTVGSGDEVIMETWSHWGGRVVPDMTLEDVLALRRTASMGPHSMTGPIEIASAEPGDLLQVDVLELRPGQWGFNLALPAPLGRGVLAERFPLGSLRHLRLDRETMTTELVPGVELPLSPFLGIMGVAPAEDGPHSSVPPGPFGGNLDLRDIQVGTSLFLPVFRPGAGFYAGDAHAAQGDGEVNQTAIETSMEIAHLRLTALPRADRLDLPELPWVETPTHLVTIGLDEDLDEAVRQAVDSLVTHVSNRFGLEPIDAYALASLAADVEVTQAVNQVKGAHARLPWRRLPPLVGES